MSLLKIDRIDSRIASVVTFLKELVAPKVTTNIIAVDQIDKRTGVNPTFLTSPLMPTPTAGDNSTKGATTAFVQAVKSEILAYVPTGPYGLTWNQESDTYTRLGVNNVTQIQANMKRCVLNANGSVNYYLHPTDSTKKADGTVATIDGSAGNVMVEIPKFWYKYSYENGNHTYMISPTATAGYIVHPAFTRGGVEVAYRYYRAYEGYLNGTKLISGSGFTPTRSRSIVQFRADALVNGLGWSQIEWTILNAVQLLALIEFGTFNLQSKLGTGNDSGADYGLTTGATNILGNSSSGPVQTNLSMSYRGIENWYADCWEWIDGINVQNYVPFINNQLPVTYVSDTFTGNYVATGVTMPASSGAYISKLANTSAGFIPSAASGSSSTYITDGLWTATGNMAVEFGGYADTGLLAGGFCLYVAHASSGVSVGIGAGVSF